MKGDNKIIESYTGVAKNNRASRMPATLDWLQSATGLFLALFMNDSAYVFCLKHSYKRQGDVYNHKNV